ncbi:aminotransferase-like domain-containing protein [Tissierella creatinophila]|uniref:2-aminoadipate transaminase n=1 Tax=Tissierella creatinophila DSM 6911 TaxID=1123403 RepID=A0A1U7M5T6_TISCR|nr:PLP-dependent aminotransferase family protein [Tissierella creatinophila]OLS02651.1 2-aminoadipate transaminase [Tissierella creatinophila DSM 6911]
MTLKYADRMSRMKASDIRELLKLTQDPTIISFAGGLPAEELFPVEELMEISQKVLEDLGGKALQYSTTEGHIPLRKAIAKRMKKLGIDMTEENILITNGSQQGLEFSGKLFINEGDVVLCERPTYLGAIDAFKAYGPEFIEIQTDDNGMIMEDLERVLKETKKVKFIYLVPDFQNPSGRTWNRERRKRLVELANQYDVAIIEDNPYGELRFEGELLPAVAHYDTTGNVVFLGTLSKIFCPGLRIGWIAAKKEVIEKYVLIKQSSDLQTNTLSQMQASMFLEEYDIEAHIEKIKNLYRTRRDLMMKTMKEEFPEGVSWTYPEGGLFIWVVLPEHMNGRELAIKALEQNVAYVPGGAFFANGGQENTFRLNFSSMDEARIVEGIKRLGKVLREEI